MKLISTIFFLVLAVLLTRCQKYEHKTYPSLSGDYIIDNVICEHYNGNAFVIDSTIRMGNVYLNPAKIYPVDTIWAGQSNWAFDYFYLYMKPGTNLGIGIKHWQEKYFYSVNQVFQTATEFGNIECSIKGTKVIFEIMDDQPESLLLRTKGNWLCNGIGPERRVTLSLRRVGP